MSISLDIKHWSFLSNNSYLHVWYLEIKKYSNTVILHAFFNFYYIWQSPSLVLFLMPYLCFSVRINNWNELNSPDEHLMPIVHTCYHNTMENCEHFNNNLSAPAVVRVLPEVPTLLSHLHTHATRHPPPVTRHTPHAAPH